MNNIIDLHMHSNASDGTDTPEELLNKIIQSGIKIFALTDHDTITGAMKMKKIIPENVKFIQGIEFSCRHKIGKCHILGLNYDENNSVFQEALRAGEKLRHEKFYKRIEILRDKFNIVFTPEEVETLSKIPAVGKPHLANLIVAKGFAENKPEAFARYVDKCKTENDKIDADLAIHAINSSGGVSVWAHPMGGEREPELTEEIFNETLDELISYGLKGLECFYSKYEMQRCRKLAEKAEEKGLFVSGGSDYHGFNKNIPLGKLNSENIFVDEKFLSVLKGVNLA